MDIDVAHFNLMRESKENANSNLKVVSALKVETLNTWLINVGMFRAQ